MVSDTINDDNYEVSKQAYQYDEVPENKSWAATLPVKQGLYDPEYEKDACGVGFVCNIKGVSSHKIVSDAKYLLCNMTHRGAVSSDGNGDGAGILMGISHRFFHKEFKYLLDLEIPNEGQYAIGNIFFKKDEDILAQSKETFEQLAKQLGLLVLGWRKVPTDSSILGTSALSREPIILQPIVVLAEMKDDRSITTEEFESKYENKLQKQLYILRKLATNSIGLQNWFYVCSLSNKTIVYKGQLTPSQVYNYYHDLQNADYESHFALVHSRFSTNTFPSWDRAQPLRWLAHNGEINTLRGNKNWMRSREGVMESRVFGEELDKLYPIIEEGGSDSAAVDNVLELLTLNGVLSLPEAVMILVPEAWENDKNMDSKKKAFYQWAACLMEPWDGPALFTFTDGRYCGATLDRNGLRPCRYYITDDDRIICGSEVGVIPISNHSILSKGRLEPGTMLLVDTKLGKIVDDKELKNSVATKFDFKTWLSKIIKLENLYPKLESKNIKLSDLPIIDPSYTTQSDPRLMALGYTFEQLALLLGPMALKGEEALGSMGNDAPLPCLNENPVLMYDYFKQLFAQVTNPPIDPIREANVMSLKCFVGPQGNLLEMTATQCERLLLESPILKPKQFKALQNISEVIPSWKVANIDITFDKEDGLLGYVDTIQRITTEASEAIYDDCQIIVLSDKAIGKTRVSISALIAVGAIHHHLIRQKLRSKVALVLETGEAREVHHFCVLLGYGADAIYPYLAIETLIRMKHEGLIRSDDITDTKVMDNYIKGSSSGILKVMSMMGISTLASYKGAQIFEALGIDNSVIDVCFNGTASRIKGVTFEYIAQDAFSLHERGYPSRKTQKPIVLPESGEYHWRDGGVRHINDPVSIASLQDAVRNKNEHAFEIYTKKEIEAIRDCTLRGMLDLDYENSTPIPLDQVEPWTEIARRFATGAMSYGSISMEAHSTLAVAMNRLNAKSNSGEGGEDPERSIVNGNGDSMRSAIKQVASGRFGVTSYYLSDADDLQIKMAQSAKPGQGGELRV
ncbi:glutamate synthase (NADPH/NADH) [Wickerhamomyces ciferrii]|uniref:glutamate synthase (ferredoxin) n=1 Tax=Wickerhamomyces ciferrii (strain ATCC 14091 / BCRC 22168 / CBS 111 / JCM 3599 / NBRC 0793 / NRRL Y-1031 F-60-10) TaxID=1206466 RepID=K0KS80_WICCF|nr:glutamate synthase (NADPH/NADH) [Wickerhamomyces ciferrii]CCH44198.1 glutamate synthase (NADPH/NADH) [Wickerhamomyces ciferrii]